MCTHLAGFRTSEALLYARYVGMLKYLLMAAAIMPDQKRVLALRIDYYLRQSLSTMKQSNMPSLHGFSLLTYIPLATSILQVPKSFAALLASSDLHHPIPISAASVTATSFTWSGKLLMITTWSSLTTFLPLRSSSPTTATERDRCLFNRLRIPCRRFQARTMRRNSSRSVALMTLSSAFER